MNQSYLEYIICLLQPDRIVHLASISNTEECEKNPIRTIDTNGRLVANLCDIIYRNKLHCKLFHASSSELYKGHQEYVINDCDESFFPTTMYGISKEMKTNKYNKDVIINVLVDFENNPINIKIVSKRQSMWYCINKLKNDKFMKKYVLW